MNHEGAWIHKDYTAEFTFLDLCFGALKYQGQAHHGMHRGREIRYDSALMFKIENALRDAYGYVGHPVTGISMKECEWIAREYSLARGIAHYYHSDGRLAMDRARRNEPFMGGGAWG